MKKTKKHSDKELAEAYIFPHDLSDKEKAQADKELLAVRMQSLRNMSDEQKLYSDIVQLKYKLEDYIDSADFSRKYTFGYFLNEYLRILKKKNKEFAIEIDLHQTKLSRLLNDVEEPNKQLMYRLEYHSSKLIPALTWWKLIEKAMEFNLVNDKETQKREYLKVKNKLSFSF